MKPKLPSLNYIFACLAGILMITGNTQAQNDTEFWFAAPEISQNGTRNFDRPIYLRLSTLGQPATVTVSLPANPTFIPIVVNLPANTTQSVNLTPFINILETRPPNTVLTRGLHVSSTARVAAYYEVASTNCNCNPEIFALKGKDALGTEFYTPFQNLWTNSNAYNPVPYSAFDIVATEDNTTITITPTNHVVGHSAGIPYTITLNRGQTYSARAFSTSAARHLGGSHVVSDKPIAVTIKDDLLRIGTCADVMGDQLVPVHVTGTTYIVMRGFMDPGLEHAFILATQDNTTLTINGAFVATLNAGQTYTYQVNDPAAFIETSAPAYVLHASGFGCEVGGAILPPVECTGSNQIGFTRSTTESMGLNIMVKAGAEGDFLLNGNPALVPATAFAPVPGTAGEWMYAQLTFSTAEVPVGAVSSLTNNTDLFHLGIINGGAVTGSRFGYFSGFNTLNLGPDQVVCRGDTVILDADDDKDTYLWSDGSTGQTLAVTDSGTYTLIATKGSCVLHDTLHVGFFPPTGAEFPAEDTTLCQNTSLLLDATTPNATYQWQDNSTAPTYNVTSPGVYTVEVTDGNGCVESDTINVHYESPPQLSVSNDTVLCSPGDATNLLAMVANDSVPTSYSWSTGDTTSSIQVAPTTTSSYTVAATNFCGTTTSRPVTVAINPELSLSAQLQDASCFGANNGSIALTSAGGAGGYVYNWAHGASSASLTGLAPGTYALSLQDAIGCSLDTTFTISEPPMLLAGVSEVQDVDCFGNATGRLTATAEGGTPGYEFSLDGVTYSNIPRFDALPAGQYLLHVRDAQACVTVDTVRITEPDLLVATANQTDASCFGFADGRAQALITGGTAPYQPMWVDAPSGPVDSTLVTGLPTGTYQFVVQDANGCQAETSVSIAQPDAVEAFVVENEPAYCLEANGYAVVDARGGSGAGYSFVWQTQPVQTTARASNLQGGTYQVIATDGAGCSDSLMVSIRDVPPAIADFATDPSPEKPILESRARIKTLNLSEFSIEYHWDMGDGTTYTNVEEPFHEYTAPGVYTIVLTAFDSTYNCPDTDSLRIEIIPDGKIHVPTAFTPNADGINDEFRLFGEGVVSVQCLIFDRWGREVARLNDMIATWDGRDRSGRPVPEGVYVYAIKATYNSGVFSQQGGTITLIR